MVTMRSAGTSAIVSFSPFGHRISSEAFVSPPKPKCSRRSFTERYDDCASTAWACFLSPYDAITVAPIAERFDCTPANFTFSQ